MWKWWTKLKAWWNSKSLDELIVDVQTATEKSCRFLPTATSVLAMLTAGNPTAIGAAAVAKAICTAVSRKSAKRVHPQQGWGKVNGVEIEGDFR